MKFEQQLRPLKPAISDLDPGIQGAVQELLGWYFDELASSLELLYKATLQRPSTLEARIEVRHMLRSFVVDAATSIEMVGPIWIRLLDSIDLRCLRDEDARQTVRQFVEMDSESDHAASLAELPRELSERIRMLSARVPASGIELLMRTIQIQRRVFLALEMATARVLELTARKI